MRHHHRPRPGDGTAWLVVDRAMGDYLCYWYTGTGGGHLVEHTRAASAEEAVAWGHQRTPRVRIRTADTRTYWAGTTPTPEGFAHTWTQPDAANVAVPLSVETGLVTGMPADEPAAAGRLADRGQLVSAGHLASGGGPC